MLCRFMNGTTEGNGIHSEAEAAALVQNVKFSGGFFVPSTAVHGHERLAKHRSLILLSKVRVRCVFLT